MSGNNLKVYQWKINEVIYNKVHTIGGSRDLKLFSKSNVNCKQQCHTHIFVLIYIGYSGRMQKILVTVVA